MEVATAFALTVEQQSKLSLRVTVPAVRALDSLTSDSVQVRVRDVDTVNIDASVEPSLATVKRKSPLLALASCFVSLSALLLIVGAPPISLLAAPVGVFGGFASLARIGSAST